MKIVACFGSFFTLITEGRLIIYYEPFYGASWILICPSAPLVIHGLAYTLRRLILFLGSFSSMSVISLRQFGEIWQFGPN